MTDTTSAALLAVQTAHAAATNKWAGREWDDGDCITPDSTDEAICRALERDEMRVTSWGIPDDGSHLQQTWRRNCQAAWASLTAAVAFTGDNLDSAEPETANFTSGKADDEAIREACDRLRELASESDAGVTARSERAEDAARDALEAAAAGDTEAAIDHAERAAAIEREFGADPTWGPFAEAVRTWASLARVDAARLAFRARFPHLAAAIEFEQTVLSAGREFMPSEVLDVLDGGSDSVAYYDWLCDQLDEMEETESAGD